MKRILRFVGILAVVMAAFIMMPLARGTAYADQLDEGVLYVGGQDIVAEGGTVTGDGGQGTAVLSYDEDGNPVLTLNNYKCENCTGGSRQTYCSVIHYNGDAKLTIQITGENAVKPADSEYVVYGINSAGPLVIKGDGILTATGTRELAVYGIYG